MFDEKNIALEMEEFPHSRDGRLVPVACKVLKAWRGHKEGDEFQITSRAELAGAIVQERAGVFKIARDGKFELSSEKPAPKRRTRAKKEDAAPADE